MFFLLVFVIFIVVLVILNPAPMSGDWQKATRKSAGLVPLAQDDLEAKIQIYEAKAFAWRGKFSVHTWIAVKEKNSQSYFVSHVALWNLYNSNVVIAFEKDLPDRYWYGAKPKIIFSASGSKAEKIIPKIYQAINSYPYPTRYNAYPGPNSNSFISFIIRQTPEIKIALPSNAIGKDWLCGKRKFFAICESKTGIQFCAWGMFGVLFGLVEGFEINIIGLSFGIDFMRPALKLPIIGRVGFGAKIN